MNIRKAKIEDAQKYLDMLKKLDTQTKNMMFEEGERKSTVEQIEQRIKSMSGEDGLILLIDDDKEIGGFLAAQRGMPNRIKHSAYIVIGMLEKYRGQHFGTKLFEEMEKWAVLNNITRLELTVVKDNKNAVALYKKMGFKIEGIKEKSMIIDNNYIDEYYMGKIII